ncbi:MAG: lectin-like domain-containing protein, partial [Bradymonadia bacterium]
SGSFFSNDEQLEFSGHVTDASGRPAASVHVKLIDDSTSRWADVYTNELGHFTVRSEILGLTAGRTTVRAEMWQDEQPCLESTEVTFYLCRSQINEDFTTFPEQWTLYRDAYWDPNGWLEMTGIEQERKGAVYNTVDSISSGVASLQFTITTGGGINDGADGFAFTIVEITNPEELSALLEGAATGGGLGYGVGGGYTDPDFNLPGSALTVEIDTWFNQQDDVQRHTDPTSVNHIAITQNADAGDHIAWFEVPDIEDLEPHTIRVDLVGDVMRITYDGQPILEQPITFTFKGGYMFFSGSTGWATNYHRFDNLQILHGCQ